MDLKDKIIVIIGSNNSLNTILSKSIENYLLDSKEVDKNNIFLEINENYNNGDNNIIDQIDLIYSFFIKDSVLFFILTKSNKEDFFIGYPWKEGQNEEEIKNTCFTLNDLKSEFQDFVIIKKAKIT